MFVPKIQQMYQIRNDGDAGRYRDLVRCEESTWVLLDALIKGKARFTVYIPLLLGTYTEASAKSRRAKSGMEDVPVSSQLEIPLPKVKGGGKKELSSYAKVSSFPKFA